MFKIIFNIFVLFENAVWRDATPEEEQETYEILARIQKARGKQ
jgi:hypothetical protein